MTAQGAPACRFCRENAPSYYIHCPGCQARRQQAVSAWVKLRKDAPLPEPSRGSD